MSDYYTPLPTDASGNPMTLTGNQVLTGIARVLGAETPTIPVEDAVPGDTTLSEIPQEAPEYTPKMIWGSAQSADNNEALSAYTSYLGMKGRGDMSSYFMMRQVLSKTGVPNAENLRGITEPGWTPENDITPHMRKLLGEKLDPIIKAEADLEDATTRIFKGLPDLVGSSRDIADLDKKLASESPETKEWYNVNVRPGVSQALQALNNVRELVKSFQNDNGNLMTAGAEISDKIVSEMASINPAFRDLFSKMVTEDVTIRQSWVSEHAENRIMGAGNFLMMIMSAGASEESLDTLRKITAESEAQRAQFVAKTAPTSFAGKTAKQLTQIALDLAMLSAGSTAGAIGTGARLTLGSAMASGSVAGALLYGGDSTGEAFVGGSGRVLAAASGLLQGGVEGAGDSLYGHLGSVMGKAVGSVTARFLPGSVSKLASSSLVSNRLVGAGLGAGSNAVAQLGQEMATDVANYGVRSGLHAMFGGAEAGSMGLEEYAKPETAAAIMLLGAVTGAMPGASKAYQLAMHQRLSRASGVPVATLRQMSLPEIEAVVEQVSAVQRFGDNPPPAATVADDVEEMVALTKRMSIETLRNSLKSNGMYSKQQIDGMSESQLNEALLKSGEVGKQVSLQELRQRLTRGAMTMAAESQGRTLEFVTDHTLLESSLREARVELAIKQNPEAKALFDNGLLTPEIADQLVEINAVVSGNVVRIAEGRGSIDTLVEELAEAHTRDMFRNGLDPDSVALSIQEFIDPELPSANYTEAFNNLTTLPESQQSAQVKQRDLEARKTLLPLFEAIGRMASESARMGSLPDYASEDLRTLNDILNESNAYAEQMYQYGEKVKSLNDAGLLPAPIRDAVFGSVPSSLRAVTALGKATSHGASLDHKVVKVLVEKVKKLLEANQTKDAKAIDSAGQLSSALEGLNKDDLAFGLAAEYTRIAGEVAALRKEAKGVMTQEAAVKLEGLLKDAETTYTEFVKELDAEEAAIARGEEYVEGEAVKPIAEEANDIAEQEAIELEDAESGRLPGYIGLPDASLTKEELEDWADDTLEKIEDVYEVAINQVEATLEDTIANYKQAWESIGFNTKEFHLYRKVLADEFRGIIAEVRDQVGAVSKLPRIATIKGAERAKAVEKLTNMVRSLETKLAVAMTKAKGTQELKANMLKAAEAEYNAEAKLERYKANRKKLAEAKAERDQKRIDMYKAMISTVRAEGRERLTKLRERRDEKIKKLKELHAEKRKQIFERLRQRLRARADKLLERDKKALADAMLAKKALEDVAANPDIHLSNDAIDMSETAISAFLSNPLIWRDVVKKAIQTSPREVTEMLEVVIKKNAGFRKDAAAQGIILTTNKDGVKGLLETNPERLIDLYTMWEQWKRLRKAVGTTGSVSDPVAAAAVFNLNTPAMVVSGYALAEQEGSVGEVSQFARDLMFHVWSLSDTQAQALLTGIETARQRILNLEFSLDEDAQAELEAQNGFVTETEEATAQALINPGLLRAIKGFARASKNAKATRMKKVEEGKRVLDMIRPLDAEHASEQADMLSNLSDFVETQAGKLRWWDEATTIEDIYARKVEANEDFDALSASRNSSLTRSHDINTLGRAIQELTGTTEAPVASNPKFIAAVNAAMRGEVSSNSSVFIDFQAGWTSPAQVLGALIRKFEKKNMPSVMEILQRFRDGIMRQEERHEQERQKVTLQMGEVVTSAAEVDEVSENKFVNDLNALSISVPDGGMVSPNQVLTELAIVRNVNGLRATLKSSGREARLEAMREQLTPGQLLVLDKCMELLEANGNFLRKSFMNTSFAGVLDTHFVSGYYPLTGKLSLPEGKLDDTGSLASLTTLSRLPGWLQQRVTHSYPLKDTQYLPGLMGDVASHLMESNHFVASMPVREMITNMQANPLYKTLFQLLTGHTKLGAELQAGLKYSVDLEVANRDNVSALTKWYKKFAATLYLGGKLSSVVKSAASFVNPFIHMGTLGYKPSVVARAIPAMWSGYKAQLQDHRFGTLNRRVYLAASRAERWMSLQPGDKHSTLSEDITALMTAGLSWSDIVSMTPGLAMIRECERIRLRDSGMTHEATIEELAGQVVLQTLAEAAQPLNPSSRAAVMRDTASMGAMTAFLFKSEVVKNVGYLMANMRYVSDSVPRKLMTGFRIFFMFSAANYLAYVAAKAFNEDDPKLGEGAFLDFVVPFATSFFAGLPIFADAWAGLLGGVTGGGDTVMSNIRWLWKPNQDIQGYIGETVQNYMDTPEQKLDKRLGVTRSVNSAALMIATLLAERLPSLKPVASAIGAAATGLNAASQLVNLADTVGQQSAAEKSREGRLRAEMRVKLSERRIARKFTGHDWLTNLDELFEPLPR